MTNTSIDQRLMDKPRPSDNLILPKIRFKGTPLNDRQVRILELIGDGHSNSEISKMMSVSDRSVDSYIYDIRNLISRELGYRLGERELVLFAKDMLDGYVAYVRLLAEQELLANTDQRLIRLGSTQLIEDWEDEEDDDYDDEEEELDRLFPRRPDSCSTEGEVDIADFQIERIVVEKQPNKYLVL